MSAQGVKAAGCIVFRRPASQVLEFLMLRASYGSKHWTPPKGHVDPGEGSKETALRETGEETGLKSTEDIELVNNFFVEAKYDVKSHVDGVVRTKIVTYFLAELKDPHKAIQLSEEHTEFKWLTVEEALKIGGFDNMIDVFKNCEAHIRSMER